MLLSPFQLAWCKQRCLAPVVVDEHVRPVSGAFSPELLFRNPLLQPYCFVWTHIWPSCQRMHTKYQKKHLQGRVNHAIWPINVVKCPTGKQFGIHQAKNELFFQIQMAFMDYVIAYQTAGELGDSANGIELSNGSANIFAFCLQMFLCNNAAYDRT